MWNNREEMDNIKKGWLNTGQEKRYYANEGAGIVLFVIVVMAVYFLSKIF